MVWSKNYVIIIIPCLMVVATASTQIGVFLLLANKKLTLYI